eukprot:TRINITY_DN1281_c0_g1_i3.p1 TRINITY_DN1281_c0_g1~~TRINITY_DN1281_c0_g1_i3.p1  ORF type:complete len:259 (-),score=29.96 TRINITY_DN1281_c0_g1_i3:202-978(-)
MAQPTAEEIEKLRELLREQNPDIDIQIAESGEADYLSDQFCERWLLDNNNKPEIAAKKIFEHLQWRIDVGIVMDNMIDEAEIESILATKSVFLQGIDKEKNVAVVYAMMSRHDPKIRTVDTWTKFVIYCLEGAVRYMKHHGMPDGKFLLIQDMTDYGLANVDLQAGKIMMDTLQTHFPGRLEKQYMYESPFLFKATFEVLQRMFTANTDKRVQFLYQEKGGLEVLQAAVDKSLLLEKFGGTATEKDQKEMMNSIIRST